MVAFADGVLTAASTTYNAFDSITGTAATGETLSVVVQGDYANNTDITLANAAISGIESVLIRSLMTVDGTGDTLTFDAGSAAGENLLVSNQSTGAVAFTNVASGTTIQATGNASVTNGALTATYSAGVSTATFTATGGTRGTGAVAIDPAAAATLTTFNVNSTGTSNLIGALSTTGTATAVNINATTAFLTTGLTVGTNALDQALVISGAAGDLAATATAAARSAVSIGALDADFKSVNASGLTAGGVSLTLSATTTTSFTGGAGNDTVTTGAQLITAGLINAGNGTADRLIVAASNHLDSTAEAAVYSGFEVLQAENGISVDMDFITASTITTVALNDGNAATVVTDMTATQGLSVNMLAVNGAFTLGIKGATTVGTLNTINVLFSDGDTTGAEDISAGSGTLTMDGIETVNLTAFDEVDLGSLAAVTGMTSLVVTGAGGVTVTTGAMAVTANLSVNYSGVTSATAVFSAAGGTGNAFAFTGGTAAETVSTNVIGGNVITTAAGNDVIEAIDKTGGTSADQITLGVGADIYNFNDARGNAAQEQVTFIITTGDSVGVAGATTVAQAFAGGLADSINEIISGTAAAAGAGNVFTIDSNITAVAVSTGTALTFGTTTVTNAGDWYVLTGDAVAGDLTAWAFQDTNLNSKIDATDTMIRLVGDADFVAGEFALSATGGNLVFTSA